MSAVKNRLEQFIKAMNLSTRSFERSINASVGFVRNIRQSISPDKQSDILKVYPNLNMTWLLLGEGCMLRDDSVVKNTSYNLPEFPKETTKKDPQSKIVPLIPISAQGGSLNDFSISVMNYECEKVVSPMMDVDFAISISGDSMAPEYPSGCQVLIKKINESAFIEWGKVYVLDTCNGTIIKKLMPSESSDRVVCVSINPAYPQFEVAFKYIQGIYRVMMVMAVK